MRFGPTYGNCCAGDRRLRRIQGSGAGLRVAEAAARPKGRRLMRGTRARYRAAWEIPVGSKFTPPVSAGGFFFYPHLRTIPRAACRPPLHPARKPAPPHHATAGPRHPPYGYPGIYVRLQGGVLTPPQKITAFCEIAGAACRPPLHPARKPAIPAQRHGGAKAPALRIPGNLRPLAGWGLDPTAGNCPIL